ncbi:Hypothetical predicted protein [Mytilus galloprovincialis]|uniref:Uncharacterized protein n=1 Tax=Mytilus galloprovincialis TaxID=29158 RepID=A0A8B6GCT3_MYTGA|nr:Hypothetical predicted protein [Mytilus galloprovincialis]
MKQITKQLTRLRELELEPVSFMFLVKDEMTRVRRSRPRYIGKGVLYHKFKNVQSLLTKEELARAKTLESYYPSRNDIRQDVPMITPSKLHFGPGHSKQLAETQKKALEGTTTSLDTSETFTISVDSPLQNIRNRTKKQNAQKAPKETSRRKKANGKLKTALIQKEEPDKDESANLTPYELFRHENIKDNEQFLQNLNFVNTLKKTQKPRKTNVSRKKTTVKINTTFAVLQPGLDLHEDNDENEEKRNTEIDVPCVNPATSIADVLDQNVWIAVAFEDTWYPGLVDSIEPDGLLVNFMHPCLLEKNKFQWPKKVDTMKVEKNNCQKERRARPISDNLPIPVEAITQSVTEMELCIRDTALQYFLADAKKTDGNDYPSASLYQWFVAIRGQIRLSDPAVNLLTQPTYVKCRKVLDSMMKKRSAEGLGVASRRRAEPMSSLEENILWERAVIGSDNPPKLLDTMVYLNGLHFALRGDCVQQLDLEGRRTNHRLRASTATRLYQAGVEDQLICETTGSFVNELNDVLTNKSTKTNTVNENSNLNDFPNVANLNINENISRIDRDLITLRGEYIQDSEFLNKAVTTISENNTKLNDVTTKHTSRLQNLQNQMNIIRDGKILQNYSLLEERLNAVENRLSEKSNLTSDVTQLSQLVSDLANSLADLKQGQQQHVKDITHLKASIKDLRQDVRNDSLRINTITDRRMTGVCALKAKAELINEKLKDNDPAYEHLETLVASCSKSVSDLRKKVNNVEKNLKSRDEKTFADAIKANLREQNIDCEFVRQTPEVLNTNR